jgi:putative phage-type endonuclease
MNINICPESLIDTCLKRGVSTKSTNQFVKTLFPDSSLDVSMRKKQIQRYTSNLKDLMKIPVIEQKSPEWYEMRRNLITASDFAQALGEGKFGSQKQLYKNKCGYEEVVFNASLPPLKWGNMFEYVAQTIYAQRCDVKVHEFGLVKHPSIECFGASPDGITEDGIMLEIKCPYKRKITGEIPMQYYYQIQGQLDVCDLDECDYEECEFKESRDFIPGGVGKENGCILENKVSGKYIYSDIKVWSEDDLQKWCLQSLDGSSPDDFVYHFWALEKYNVIRVFRNKDFFDEKIVQLQEVWDKIKEYRGDETLYQREVVSASSSEGRTSKRGGAHALQLEDFLLV